MPIRADAETMDVALFRRLLRRHAAGVVVVTAPGEPPAGFTATSFTSVSLEPPLVSFALSRDASTWPAMMAADTVAVHVLTSAQEQVARTFATSGIDRFAAHGAWHPGPGGVPLLDSALARILCQPVHRIPAGDHTIILAAPIDGEIHPDNTTTPLIYRAGKYTAVR